LSDGTFRVVGIANSDLGMILIETTRYHIYELMMNVENLINKTTGPVCLQQIYHTQHSSCSP